MGLHRSVKNQIIGGVAGGLSDYFDIDLWIVRLIFLILLFSGGGFLIYLIMWISIPIEITENHYFMENQETNKRKNRGEGNGNIVAGVILISIGILFLVDRYFPEIDFRDLWPWILIVIGSLILVRGIKNN